MKRRCSLKVNVQKFGVVALTIGALMACKIPQKKSNDGDQDNNGTSAAQDSGHDYVPGEVQFPPNGTVLKDYESLTTKAQLLSAAFPSSTPVQKIAAASLPPSQGLSLMDGAPTSGSIIDQLGNSMAQVRSKGGNDVFLSVDKSGNYAIVVYANSNIGYFFPSNGDLASCRSVYAPIGNQSLPLLDCVDIGPFASVIADGSNYSNGQRIRSGARLYFENGQTFYDGSYTYYQTGQTLRSSGGST